MEANRKLQKLFDFVKWLKNNELYMYTSGCSSMFGNYSILLTLLHSEWPKLHGVLAVLSAIGLRNEFHFSEVNQSVNSIGLHAK